MLLKQQSYLILTLVTKCLQENFYMYNEGISLERI